VLTVEDLAECQADVIQPIKYDYKVGQTGDKGVTLWEVCHDLHAFLRTWRWYQCPPNGQGLTALIALGIVEAIEELHGIDILELEHNSTQYLHILIEALRLAFADSQSTAV
jgi:gamma-glutamyltranspeptidase/glutathione hydrolase